MPESTSKFSLDGRLIFELTPQGSKFPHQVEAASEKELVVALAEIMKLPPKTAKAVAHLLFEGASVEMPDWSARLIGRLTFQPITQPRLERKKRTKGVKSGRQADQTVKQVGEADLTPVQLAPEPTQSRSEQNREFESGEGAEQPTSASILQE
ncbi:hypothetical protein [Deinococcus sp. Marseille-Q6407]|uniref:hypothetical protein n=1 Tax=Deinococcus sp. Marseille-Q6407 TaxID=2969223 RepID=UPI0021C0F12D|nr:hypothetical protein [Deinococcus sp. Marseille-Q6407]